MPNTEEEKSNLQFDLEMAEIVWLKVKGYPIPECYSIEDKLSILSRYWHRAMEKE
jgi:glucose-6-phosphate isomerase